MINNLINTITNSHSELTMDEKVNLIDNYEDDKNILLKKISNIFLSEDDPTIDSINMSDNVIKDLNIFYDSNQSSENSVLSTINMTDTLYGEYTLRYWLSSPTVNHSILWNRQENIKKLIKNKIQYDNIRSRINNIKSSESKIIWFWEDVTEDTQSLYDMVYFKMPFVDKFLNNNELILNISNIYKIFIAPFLTIATPIITVLVPYILLLVFKQNIGISKFLKLVYNMTSILPSFASALPGNFGKGAKYATIFVAAMYVFLYIQSGYFSVKGAYDTNKIINILHKKINNISYLVKNVSEIHQLTKDINCSMKVKEDLNYMEGIFSSNLFNNDPKLLTNKGKILSVYNIFLENKNRLINILKYLGEIDVYISLCNLYKKFSKTNNKYCFVKYKYYKSKHVIRPYIRTKGLWHPNLIRNPISNDMTLGNKNKNLLITGPNKAGKSIFIKSLAISVLFAQTIGMVSASKYIITPFSVINSYLHIPDSTGYESLFEAEMYRAKNHIDMLKEIDQHKYAFIIMDEIFTSTNHIEGNSAAYAVTKKLTGFINSMSIITTHFTELHKLEEKTEGKIKNYKFTIERDDEGGIKYPHKLERGYSKQYIALELLKNNNFDMDIINDALEICNVLKDGM